MKTTLSLMLIMTGLFLGGCPSGSGDSGGGNGGPSALAISPSVLADATIGENYSATILASGGTDSGFVWSVVAGTLPPGLTLTPSGTPSTILAGTPTQSGAFNFTIGVEDDASNTRQRSYSIEVGRRWFVYHADEDVSGDRELYAVDTSLSPYGASTKLNPALPPGQEVSNTGSPVVNPLFSPDGLRLVYGVELRGAGLEDLYTNDMNATTPGAATQVNPALPTSGTVGDTFWWSSDSQWLMYTADQTTLGTRELWAIDMAAPGSPGMSVKVNDTLAPGGEVPEDLSGGNPFSPDGTRVAYVAQENTAGLNEVYYATFSGGTFSGRQKISGAMAAGATGATMILWAPDGNSLVYAADQDTAGSEELYWVDISGGTPTAPQKINAPYTITPAGDGDVVDSAGGGDIGFAPDSSGLLYRADATNNSSFQLFYVDLTAASPAGVEVNGILPSSSADINSFIWHPSSNWFVFNGDQDVDGEDNIYQVVLTGGIPGAPMKINQTLPAGADVQTQPNGLGYNFSPGGDSICYRVEAVVDGEVDLFWVDVSSGTPGVPMQVNTPRPGPGADVNSFEFSPDGSTVLLNGDLTTASTNEIYLVPLGPGGPGTQVGPVNPTPVAGGSVLSGFSALGYNAAGDQIWFRGDVDADNVYEFWIMDVAGTTASTPVKVNGTMLGDAKSGVFQP